MSALVLGPILLRLNDVATVYVPRVTTETVEGEGRSVTKSTENFSADLQTDVTQLKDKEALKGPQSRTDSSSYWVWHKEGDAGGPPRPHLLAQPAPPPHLLHPGVTR